LLRFNNEYTERHSARSGRAHGASSFDSSARTFDKSRGISTGFVSKSSHPAALTTVAQRINQQGECR